MYTYMKEYIPTLIDSRITEDNTVMFVVADIPFVFERQNAKDTWKIYGFEKYEAFMIISKTVNDTAYEPFVRELLGMVKISYSLRRKVFKITEEEINNAPNRCFIKEEELKHISGITSIKRIFLKNEKILDERFPNTYFFECYDYPDKSTRQNFRLPKTEIGNWNEWGVDFENRYPTSSSCVLVVDMFGEKYLYNHHIDTLAKGKAGVHIVPVYKKPNAFNATLASGNENRLQIEWGDETIITGEYPKEDFSQMHDNTAHYVDVFGRFVGQKIYRDGSIPKIEFIGEENVLRTFTWMGRELAEPYVNLGKIAFLTRTCDYFDMQTTDANENDYQLEQGYLCVPFNRGYSRALGIDLIPKEEQANYPKSDRPTEFSPEIFYIYKENEARVFVHPDSDNVLKTLNVASVVDLMRNDAILENIGNRWFIEGSIHFERSWFLGRQQFSTIGNNNKLPYKTITADLTATKEKMIAEYEKSKSKRVLYQLI